MTPLRDHDESVAIPGVLRVAISPSVKTNQWTKHAFTWPGLASRLAAHVVGSKDGECIFAGTFNGTRNGDNIATRALAILDVETNKETGEIPPAPQQVADSLRGRLACVVYTTHSHTVDMPRYRIVLPLKREFLFPAKDAHDRARALDGLATRKVAEGLGLLGVLDLSKLTVDAPMYMPRRADDAPFFSAIVEGEAVDWLAALSMVTPAYEAAERARNSRDDDETRFRSAAAQKRPLIDILGPIGRFNADHRIEDVLLDAGYVRKPGSTVDWRSPLQGSGSYATRVYGDRWVSLSGSDAAAGLGVHSKTGNAQAGDAFDVHCFFHHGNDRVAALAALQPKPGGYAGGASPPPPPPPPPPPGDDTGHGSADPPEDDPTAGDGWKDFCTKTDKNFVRGDDTNNLAIALRYADAWRGVLAYDQFAKRVMVMKPLPRPDGAPASRAPVPRALDDVDVSCALQWFHWQRVASLRKAAMFDAIIAHSHERAFHPVLDYFKAVGDADMQEEVPSQINGHRVDPGKPAADALTRLMTCGFGAVDTRLNRALSRAFGISMVRRVRHPGCQHDHMPVFVSDQGLRKSSGLRALAGAEWFADHVPDLHSKDAMIQLHGKVLIEWSEMVAMKRTDIERIKSFISSRVDTFRPPYERTPTDVPRSVSFAGTSNIGDFIDDPTGGRRFWPVNATTVDTDWITANRDLLWRLACDAEAREEPGWIVEGDLQDELLGRQADAQRDQVWDSKVMARAIEGMVLDEDYFSVVLGIKIENLNNGHLQRVSGILRRHRWWKARNTVDGLRTTRWYPPSATGSGS